MLHIFPTFAVGGSQMRLVQLANAWGPTMRHSIVASDGTANALPLLAETVPLQLIGSFPDLRAASLWSRLVAIRDAVRALAPDLICTYNWGAIEVVMARRLFGLAPLVHHEDGFGPDEAVRQNWKRMVFRRLALPGAHRVAVPSHVLADLAGRTWGVPEHKIACLANGVDIGLYDPPPQPDAIPGFVRQPGDVVIGTVTGLRREKNPVRLVRMLAGALGQINSPERVKLVIAGAGSERDAILAEADRLGVARQLHLPGFLRDPHRYMGLFDIYAIPSDTEQFPISLVEAMAARLPVVSTDVGDVRRILPADNQGLIAAAADEAALSRHLARLIADADLRQRLGAANRAHVEQHYQLHATIAAYRALYEGAIAAG